MPLSNECKRILAYANEEAERLNHRHIGTEHLLLGILREEKCVAAEILHERGLRLIAIREELARSVPDRQALIKPKETPLLSEFSRDLTQAAMDGVLDPLVGRDAEIDRVIQILCRRTKNNPVLIGDPGVGKTAIVEGLAQRIVDGEVPSFLADKRILVLDLSLIVAGTKYRGQFEERLKTIMKELVDNPNTVVFIDELHTLVGAGSAEGSLDAANILKPALSRGEIQCIGATTPAEFRKSIEKDRSLERRFQAVKVGAPSESEAVRILQGVKPRYEKFHMVNYTDEAIEGGRVSLESIYSGSFPSGQGYRSSRRSRRARQAAPGDAAFGDDGNPAAHEVHRRSGWKAPSPAKDFEKAEHYKNQEQLERENLRNVREKYNISETSSMGVVTKADIEDVVSRWTGVPVNAIKEEELQRLSRIEEELHRRIVSQETAINALARAIRRSRAGLKSPNRPAGSFLFLGPTGVGKTEMARSLAQFLFGSEKALIRFDMSEFMEKHSVSKLIGSPPGYVGYEEGGQLTERVKRNPYSVILLDEIEKAHPDVYNILLQVFEDGHLTDGLGNTIDFKNTIIIMTSNIGARFLSKHTSLGFQGPSEESTAQKMEDAVMQEVKRLFNPEFINRLDEIIIFNSLTNADLGKIVDLMVAQLNENLAHKTLERDRDRRGQAVDSRQGVQGQELRSASVAPGDSAVYRGSAFGSLDPGTTKGGPNVEVYLEGTQLWYRSGRTRRSRRSANDVKGNAGKAGSA